MNTDDRAAEPAASDSGAARSSATESGADGARAVDKVRANHWWYAATCLIMAIAVAAYYVGLKAFPVGPGGYLVPAVMVPVLLAAGCAYRLKVSDTVTARLELITLGTAAWLSVVTIVLHTLLLADGLTVWTVLAGVLPGLPFVWLASRTRRKPAPKEQ